MDCCEKAAEGAKRPCCEHHEQEGEARHH
jgi:hypothetical protein